MAKKANEREIQEIARGKLDLYDKLKKLIELQGVEDPAYGRAQMQRDLDELESQKYGDGNFYLNRMESVEGNLLQRTVSPASRTALAEARRDVNAARNNLQRKIEEATGTMSSRSPDDSGNKALAGFAGMNLAIALAFIPVVGPVLSAIVFLPSLAGFLWFGAKKLGRAIGSIGKSEPDYSLDSSGQKDELDREMEKLDNSSTQREQARQSAANVTTQKQNSQIKSEADMGKRCAKEIKDAFDAFATEDNGDYKAGFSREELADGTTKLTFPNESAQETFFRELADSNIEFEAKNSEGEVIAFSSGKGELSWKNDPGFARALQDRANAASSSPPPPPPKSEATTQAKDATQVAAIIDKFNEVAKEGGQYKQGYSSEATGDGGMKMTFPDDSALRNFFKSLANQGLQFQATNESGEVIAFAGEDGVPHLKGDTDFDVLLHAHQNPAPPPPLADSTGPKPSQEHREALSAALGEMKGRQAQDRSSAAGANPSNEDDELGNTPGMGG